MNEEFYDVVIDGKHYHIKESALNSKSGYHITDENGNPILMEPGLHTKIQELIESIKRTREGSRRYILRMFDAGKPFHWSNPSLYRSAYHSEDVVPFLNAMTAGGLNNLSPTLWFGRAVDTVDLLNGNRSFLDWANRTFVTGNSGIFTDLLVAEHPIGAAIGNGVIDILTLGGPSLLKYAATRQAAESAALQAFNRGTWKYLTYPNNAKQLYRTTVYKGGNITDPYSSYFTTDKRYASQYGPVSSYIFESKNPSFTTEPMMGYQDPVNLDMFIYRNTKSNPSATAIIGHDLVTGEFKYPSLGIEILNLHPKNVIKINETEPRTAFWNVPKGALISAAERAGIPKGERNLSVHSTPKADYREEPIVEPPLSFSEIVKPNLTRLNNLSKDREQFMLENPIYSYPSTNDVTTFQEQLESAMRTTANDPKFANRNIDGFVKYEALDPEGNTLGLTEGSLFYPDWMDPGYMGIKLKHKEGDNSLLAKLVDSHEVKHFTGNDADAYIYEYLVKNNIIDDSKISAYHKDADHGEIGTHLGELADYYGFTKPTQTSLWLTPQGKTYITAEDVEKFKEFLRENKFLEGSIFENIIDMNKFVEFYNKFKFGFVPTILGASAASTLLDNNNSSSNTTHR